MVNEITDTRERILYHLFKADGRTLSGTRIAEETGISRVAVWKHIKQLTAAGVDIQSTPGGYVLADPGNLLHPFCFPRDLREKIRYFSEADSTMTRAKALAREGAAHLSCCVAERQTKGRGRLSREWVSERGGLWFSLILRPELPPPSVYIYNFAASLTLTRILNRLYGLDVRAKWPNDLLLSGKKLTGILSEMETRADLVNFLVIGIGINVNNDPSQSPFNAVSLRNILGRSLSRREILAEFLEAFQKLIRNPDIPAIMDQWKQHTATIGQKVRVETHDTVFEGKAVDVEETGALVIQTDQGETLRIIYGDCFHT